MAMPSNCLDWPEDYGVLVSCIQVSPADLDGTALEVGSVVIDGSFSRTLVAAYLLTASAQRAEQLVLDSTHRLDMAAARGGRLSWKALDAAFLEIDWAPEQAADEKVCIPLPAEWRHVLRLSPRRRHCFVLRFLMALPRAYCAELLRIEAAEVDVNCDLAARELTDMARQTHVPIVAAM
jgi:hypothetical protein